MPNPIAQEAWKQYASKLAGLNRNTWWDVVAITASSQHQAERYRWEVERRRQQGKLPSTTRYVVIPDPEGRRIGSGGATIHALPHIRGERVLLIHSGGDSRRLPLYSVSGKLFCALPGMTPWGDVRTVFDEWMALSTLWVRDMPPGLLVGSGDVVLTFDTSGLQWTHRGVYGIAMKQPHEVGSHHGVYVIAPDGRVASFLQKPVLSDLRRAGGLLEGDEVALDSGLIRFDPEAVARLADLSGFFETQSPAIDLYQHVTMALTGQWRPRPEEPEIFHDLAGALARLPFRASIVNGEFIHIGTTVLFRQLLTAGKNQPIVIDCNLRTPPRPEQGSILYGLDGIDEVVEAPSDMVAHQSPVSLPDGTKGSVIRVYGVMDDPKQNLGSGRATWRNHAVLNELKTLGIEPEDVWQSVPQDERTLWNAELFPVGPVDRVWPFARRMLRGSGDFALETWKALPRLSLASSARYADTSAAAESYVRWLQGKWQTTAVDLAKSGADLRPMLAHPPSIGSLVEVGRRLRDLAGRNESEVPSEAASKHFESALFFEQAGLLDEAAGSRAVAYLQVERAVSGGSPMTIELPAASTWHHQEVKVSAPARIDLGGGWSDTPPFCLDWGGTVLNIAIELDRQYPIQTTIRVIQEPVVRCWSGETREERVFSSVTEISQPAGPGDPFSIPQTALRMMGVGPLIERLGRGLEICTQVNLPMGSGLGASSILAATMLRALSQMLGETLSDQALSDRVMRLEQMMTSGGGWQDQAGGIFEGAKLIHSGPGLQQRLRVQPVRWTAAREAEFETHLVLLYTGIQRVARNLLQTVVGRYLARETAAVQVLHSIKTLGAEMAYAMQEGDWAYLGSLLDRHWRLNQVLDPQTTNPQIDRLLSRVRPRIFGAKLAGAGGGGFLMMLARDREAAAALREECGEAVRNWSIAKDGLRTDAR